MKTVIFDLDNTLVDFMRMKRLSCDAAVSAMMDAGLKIDHEKGMKLLFKIYDKHGIEYHKIFQEFIKKVKGEIDWGVLAAGIIAYRRIKLGLIEPYPHVHSTLIELKARGVQLAIVSDAPRMRAWLRLAAMRLTDFFDVVVTYDDTGKRKPAKQPFIKALDLLGVAPEDALMVGDWPDRDIKGAKALGMKTAFARYGCVTGYCKNHGADYELKDIAELLKIV